MLKDFVDEIVRHGCHLAKHRKGDVLEPRDVAFHLGMFHAFIFAWIPTSD